MLALMPSSLPTTDFHTTPSPPPPMTMSLAVLPHASLPLSQSSAPLSYSSISSARPAPSKRPKLSLNTTSLPTSVGKSNTGLRLETLSVASSPTARNTFQNAFGALETNSHTRRLSSSRTRILTPQRTSSSDSVASSASSSSATSVESYATSASSTDSISPPVPYRLSYNSKSILVNGPLPRVQRRRSFTTARPMFPTSKKVSFRAPLTEEIQTVKYTMAQIDLESSDSSISTLDLPPPSLVLRGQSKALQAEMHAEKGNEPQAQGKDDDEENGLREPRSPHVGEKRESSDEEEDSDTCPSTPVTRRNKRRREWVWTLGPLKSETEHTSTVASHENKQDAGRQ